MSEQTDARTGERAGGGSVVRLTRKQVREVDRLAVEKYRMPSILLMENAARAAADVAWDMLGRVAGSRVVVLCGGGNNGGDGLAIARHLHNRGARVLVDLRVDPRKYQGDAMTNYNIIAAMTVPVSNNSGAIYKALVANRFELVIDGVFGTGLTSPPRDPFPALVATIEASDVPVLSVDLPSGLDCDTGEPLGAACVKAKKTITFVEEKAGFANPAARQYTGDVIVGDIGCPRELIRAVQNI